MTATNGPARITDVCENCDRRIRLFFGTWIHIDNNHPRCYPYQRARPSRQNAIVRARTEVADLPAYRREQLQQRFLDAQAAAQRHLTFRRI